VLALELGENGLDRMTRSAPRRPEVDHDRPFSFEHLALEAVVCDLAHGYSLPVIAAMRSAGTYQLASSTIARVIFEPPASRSTNLIGISTTLKPARSVRNVVSIWKA